MTWEMYGEAWFQQLNHTIEDIIKNHQENRKLFDLVVGLQKRHLEVQPNLEEENEELYSEYKMKKYLI